MALPLDGSPTQGGGRPVTAPSATDSSIPETGAAAVKNSNCMTLIMGINTDDERMPAYQFPLRAKDPPPTNFKMNGSGHYLKKPQCLVLPCKILGSWVLE